MEQSEVDKINKRLLLNYMAFNQLRCNDLVSIIEIHFDIKGKKFPNAWEALAWATTEMGETYELLLSRVGGWKRNNPEKEEPWSKERFAEELGDVIFMLIIAGMAEGVDPIEVMLHKLQK